MEQKSVPFVNHRGQREIIYLGIKELELLFFLLFLFVFKAGDHFS